MLATAILNPVEECTDKFISHPNAAGFSIHCSNSPSSDPLIWQPCVNGVALDLTTQGSIVVGLNRMGRRMLRTSEISTVQNWGQFNVNQIMRIPGGNSFTQTASQQLTNAFTPTVTNSVFLSGWAYDGAQVCKGVLLPQIQGSNPTSFYLGSSNGAIMVGPFAGYPSTGITPATSANLSGFTCPIFGRIWTYSTGVWTPGTWVLNLGPALQFNSGDYHLTNTLAVAYEFASTIGTDCYVQLVTNKVGTDTAYTTAYSTGGGFELYCDSFAVSWFGSIPVTEQITVAAGEIITCTASALTDGGDIAVGVPPPGMYPGDLGLFSKAGSYFAALTGLSQDKYSGAFRNGASSFHVPRATDRLVRADDKTLEDWRMYALRAPTSANGPGSALVKSDSLFNLTTPSPALHPIAVGMMPHASALWCVLQQLNRCGDNGDHVEWLKRQAASLTNWLHSDEGRATVAKGVDIAKQIGKVLHKEYMKMKAAV
jgi:hypothetical protein